MGLCVCVFACRAGAGEGGGVGGLKLYNNLVFPDDLKPKRKPLQTSFEDRSGITQSSGVLAI